MKEEEERRKRELRDKPSRNLGRDESKMTNEPSLEERFL